MLVSWPTRYVDVVHVPLCSGALSQERPGGRPRLSAHLQGDHARTKRKGSQLGSSPARGVRARTTLVRPKWLKRCL